MAAMLQNMYTLLPLQAEVSSSLGIDILIYVVMAIGFSILGFFICKFYNEARIKEMEDEVSAEKERLGRRISTLEKEIQHQYAKEDELTVVINNLKKKLESSGSKKNDKKNNPTENQQWHFELFSTPHKNPDEEE
ncbi:hypothetical protein [Membranihabitans maritimus]|uniref:hypothetical protein n=1 Tax=Membranihabitans maritimus TaxID=2904244 RepID=UPI001F3FFA9E|nr:hypothetical protein [Membranihabitans maritimus]